MKYVAPVLDSLANAIEKYDDIQEREEAAKPSSESSSDAVNGFVPYELEESAINSYFTDNETGKTIRLDDRR